MPRYKMRCSCKKEWWIRKAVKMDDSARIAHHYVMCPECAELLKQRWGVIKGVSSGPINADLEEAEKIALKIKENKEFGFARQPFRERFAEVLEGDRKTLAEGIRTRYRGFSPTMAMFQTKYRVIVGEWILDQVRKG